MLGYAYQKGLIPIAHEALEQAIELNGTAVPMNSKALLVASTCWLVVT